MNDEEPEDEAPPERLPRDQRPSRSSKRRDALAVFDLAEALVAMTEAQLARAQERRHDRALALDASLSEIIRARALSAHVRAAAGSPASLELAAQIAADEGAGSDLRAAAFASLAAHDLPRARLLGRAASGSADPILRGIARILRAR